MNHFSDCNMQWKVDFIWQLVMISLVVGPRSSKALSKAKLVPKKKGHGHCLMVCFWSDPLQLSESQQNHYTWEACSASWWDALKTAIPAASTGQQNGPNSSPWQRTTIHGTTNASKVEWTGLPSFASSAIFTCPLTNQLHFFKHLYNPLQGKCFYIQQEGENVFQEIIKSRSMDFYATGINELISRWQKCVDCNGSYFD